MFACTHRTFDFDRLKLIRLWTWLRDHRASLLPLEERPRLGNRFTSSSGQAIDRHTLGSHARHRHSSGRMSRRGTGKPLILRPPTSRCNSLTPRLRSRDSSSSSSARACLGMPMKSLRAIGDTVEHCATSEHRHWHVGLVEHNTIHVDSLA